MIEEHFSSLIGRFILVKKCFYFLKFWRDKSFACGGRCFFGCIGRLQIVLTRFFGRMQFVLTKRRFIIFILGWMGGRILFFPFFCFILFVIVYYMFIKVYYMLVLFKKGRTRCSDVVSGDVSLVVPHDVSGVVPRVVSG